MSFIHFSNDLRKLAEQLGKTVFGKRAKPFCPPTIIVPSDRYKRFLQEFLARDARWGVAMGMEITTLYAWLGRRLAEMGKAILPYALLELRLYALIKEYRFEALKEFSDQQCKTVCQELAHLFHKYGTQGELFLSNWLKKEGWQQTLWRAIYENSNWGYSTESLKFPLSNERPSLLFGFSSLPAPHAHFFKQQKAIFYLFSPCPLFWADLKTAKELAKEGVLEGSLSLLASFGKWGRRLLNELAAEEMETAEEYVEPSLSHTLGIVQKTIFDLEEMKIPSSLAETIRIVSAKHRRQEVEELLEEILRLLQERDDLLPSDILVLSPDLGLYVSHIHAVFQSASGAVDYSLRGIERGNESLLAQGILALFGLVEEKWSLEGLLTLFSQPLFAAKMGWRKNELLLIEKWLKGAGLNWGHDLEQRELSLDSHVQMDENGTFYFAIDRLLFGLTSTDSQTIPLPFPQVHWSEVELLNALLETTEDLARDLSDMIANRKKSLKEWLENLSRCIDRYFSKEEDLWIIEELQLLKQGCRDWQEPLFSWHDLKKICKECFSKQTSGYRTNNLQAVQFDLLEEGHILPKKVIVLMGMQNGAFPRTEAETSLDQLEPKPPSRGEIDRFLFLEALLKAQEVFLISFLHTCPEKNIELSPSIVVQELQNSLERCGRKLFVRVLPEKDFGVDALSSAPYFSSSRYRAAMAHSQRKEEPHYIVRDWHEEVSLPIAVSIEETEIDLADLQLLLNDPIEFYFKKKLGFVLDWIDEKPFYPEEVLISSSSRKKVIERALKSSFSTAIDEYRREKGFPFGAFRDVALCELEEKVDTLKGRAEYHGIAIQELRDRTLGKDIAPWTVDLGEGVSLTLRGTIKNVCSQGLVDFHKEQKIGMNVLKRWCDLLVLKGHPELQQIPCRLVLLEAGKNSTKTMDAIDPVSEMRKIIHYFVVAKQRLSPFFPVWSETILNKGFQALEKEWQNSFILSRYSKWLFKRDGLPDADVLHRTWHSFLQSTFFSLRNCQGEQNGTL
jgi:exodeoxyribonuclease V gamma subunit